VLRVSKGMWRWMQRNLGSSETKTWNSNKSPTENSQGGGLKTSATWGQVPKHTKSSSTKGNRNKKEPSRWSPEQAAVVIQKNWRAYQARKLVRRLRRLLEEQTKTLSLTGKGGSHDLEALFAEMEVAKALRDMERLEKVSKRCAELQEALTQKTIAVDGIPHGQSDFVRQQRKDTIKTILSLAEKADSMKEQVESAIDDIKN